MRWRPIRLADATQIIMGQAPPSETYNTVGEGLPFFQGKAEFSDLHPITRQWCSIPLRVAEERDILLSVRAPVGPTNLAKERCCIGRGLAAIRGEPSILDQRFLMFFFKQVQPTLSRLGTGSTFLAIGRKEIQNIRLSLPPLSEQRRIVEILDRADELRRLRAQANTRAERILPALFLKMFGDPATNPMGWEQLPLGELVTHLTSGSRGWSSFTGRGPGLFVRTQDILDGQISQELLAVDPPSGAEADRTRLVDGDVVVTITGIVGKAATFRSMNRDAYVSQHVALVRPDQSRILPEFLTQYANLPLGPTPVLATFQYGQTKPGLGFRELKTARIPVPPLHLQQQFQSQVVKMTTHRAHIARASHKLPQLWTTMLSRAFSGDLTASWREAHMKELLQEMEQQARDLARLREATP